MASRWHRIASIFSGLGLSFCVVAEPVGLLYPNVREPYQKVFHNIAEGAESHIGDKLHTREIAKSEPPADVQAWLQSKAVSSAIALGSQSAKYLSDTPDLPFVVGAIAAKAPDSYSSVSLNPSPELLFAGVLKLNPNIKTIHVAYDTQRNQWEVEQAQEIAESMGLSLHSYPAGDMRQAATTYRDIQKQMDPNTEALWLPLGGPARDKSIIQNILETAWRKEQIVFSSNLSDVKRGVLFAMYPDNVGMGQQLAQLLDELKANPQQTAQTHFVKSLFTAINRRTAEHLEITLGNQELSNYDFVYPPR